MAQEPDNTNLEEYIDLAYLAVEEIEVDSLQRLNLIVPKDIENPPLLVWIGGGAWSFVNRHQEMDLARKIAQNGIAVASVGHRLSAATWQDPKRDSGVKHPAHANDVARASKWLIEHAADYGYDPNNVFIGGFSSGAYEASIITLDPSITAAVGLKISDFRGVIPVSGAFDIPDYYEILKNSERPELADLHVKAVFGSTEEDFNKASGTTYLKELQIPMLLIADGALFKYTKIFEDKIREETEYTDFDVINVHHLGHGPLWRNLSHEENSIYRDMMVAFIKKHMG